MLSTYAEQLKKMAAEERVDLYDAMKQAGISRWTYYRLMAGTQSIHESTAKQIAATIKDMSAR